MRRAAGIVAVGMACAALLGACGGDDDGAGDNAERFDGERQRVAEVVDELQAAAREGNGERICDGLFTENLKISVQRASGRSCAEEVNANLEGSETTFEVVGIQLRGGSAVAQVRDENARRSSLVFLREGGDWRIARIGRLAT